MRNLELLIPPPVVAVVSAVTILVTARYDPLVHASFSGQWIVALVIVAVGSAVSFLGMFEFARARTTINPLAPGNTTTIVSTGVYRLSRNPMYLGLALVILGLAIWQSALVGYPLVIGFCAYLTRFQIIPEERILLARFGTEFSQYMGAVRRWL